MAASKWFRRTTWTPEDEADFFVRLKRSRAMFHKAQYLRIQAGHLFDSGDAALVLPALRLLDLLIAEYPDPSQLASAHAQRATCLIELGRYDDAIAAFRDAFAAGRAYPSMRNAAYLQFGELVCALRRVDLFDEALAILEEFGGHEVFPVERFQAASIRAFVASEQGRLAEAAEYARSALEAAAATESPFRRHSQLGLARFVDPEMIERLRMLAV